VIHSGSEQGNSLEEAVEQAVVDQEEDGSSPRRKDEEARVAETLELVV
jgi:hypothetical protein